MKPTLIAWFALMLGCGRIVVRADAVPGVGWHVANAQVIEVVQAETPAPAEGARVWVKDVLKGIDSTQEFLLPDGALKPGQTALVLFQYEEPGFDETAARGAHSGISVWPMDAVGNVDTPGVPAQTEEMPLLEANKIKLDLIKKDIAAGSPEEVGLNSEVLDALLFPGKIEVLASRDAQRAIYVRFVVAILGLDRDVPFLARLLESSDPNIRTAALKKLETLTGITLPTPADESPRSLRDWAQTWESRKPAFSNQPPRWPPVPPTMKAPPDAFPEPLLEALRRDDPDAFAKAFTDWLDSGVMRDREIHDATSLDRDLVEGSNLYGAVGGNGAYLPAAPRLRPDVILNKNIPAVVRMKVIALRAQIAHGKRFDREREDAKALLASLPADSEMLRRAAFWEFDTPGRVALNRLAVSGGDESTQRFVLGLCLDYHMDDDALDAARVEIQAGRQTFIDGFFAYLEAHRDDKAQWIGRLFCQEGQKQAVPVMLSWLKSNDAQVRKVAAFNLCWLPSADTIPDLLNAIHSESDPAVKAQMLVALAQTGDERGLKTLLAAAREPHAPDDADEIVRGLGRIRDPKALATLADIVDGIVAGDDKSQKNQAADGGGYLLSDAVNAFGYISHLYEAHAPDRFWSASGIDDAQLKLAVACIEQWRKSPAGK